jgi:hypothetical protein
MEQIVINSCPKRAWIQIIIDEEEYYQGFYDVFDTQPDGLKHFLTSCGVQCKVIEINNLDDPYPTPQKYPVFTIYSYIDEDWMLILIDGKEYYRGTPEFFDCSGEGLKKFLKQVKVNFTFRNVDAKFVDEETPM